MFKGKGYLFITVVAFGLEGGQEQEQQAWGPWCLCLCVFVNVVVTIRAIILFVFDFPFCFAKFFEVFQIKSLKRNISYLKRFYDYVCMCICMCVCEKGFNFSCKRRIYFVLENI